VAKRAASKKNLRNIQAQRHLALGEFERAFALAYEDTCDVKDSARLTPEMHRLYISNVTVLAKAAILLNRRSDAVEAYEFILSELVSQPNLPTATAQALEHVHDLLWAAEDNPSTSVPCYL